jgi:hypothetical protein
MNEVVRNPIVDEAMNSWSSRGTAAICVSASLLIQLQPLGLGLSAQTAAVRNSGGASI